MKQIWKELGLAWLMGFWIPGLILAAAVTFGESVPALTEPTVLETLVQVESQTIPVLMEDGTLQTMELNEYLTGVVLAEMPAFFETEALKAQAVVARTYTMRSEKHGDAKVCTDSTCCQGFISVPEYLEKGGTDESVGKIQSAVRETDGYVLTYEGQLIEATYFSCSGGSTEDAVAVWGTDVPYLRATPSPGEEEAAHFIDTVSFTPEEFSNLLGISLDGTPEQWVEGIRYTAGGGVDTIAICGTEFEGTQVRSMLGLRSTAFTIQMSSDVIEITTRGYGHRVGMSQYGADAMAAQGKSCAEILAHYYQGTTLEIWSD